MAKIGQVFLLAILLAAASCQDEGEVIQDSPLVVTPSGSIRGVKGTTEAGTKFLKFTKVPFAEPPLGYLRLRKPVKKQPWSEELDGTQPTPACPQIDLLTNSSKGQEDCLFLNIFTPITNVEDIGQADLKPVMLWIHGGGFTGGDATTLTNPEFLLDEDVVVINTSRGTPGILNNSTIVQFFQFSPNYTLPSRNQSGAFPAPGQMPTSAAAINPRQINQIDLINPINQSAHTCGGWLPSRPKSGPLVEVCRMFLLGKQEKWRSLGSPAREVRKYGTGRESGEKERADHLHELDILKHGVLRLLHARDFQTNKQNHLVSNRFFHQHPRI